MNRNEKAVVQLESFDEYKQAEFEELEGKVCSNCDGMELELDEECPDCGRVA